jgi:hypothetical protein
MGWTWSLKMMEETSGVKKSIYFIGRIRVECNEGGDAFHGCGRMGSLVLDRPVLPQDFG